MTLGLPTVNILVTVQELFHNLRWHAEARFAGRIMKRRTFLKGASVASASPASAWAPVGRETLVSLVTRHGEATKAADMFARKSNTANYSGTPTSSMLHPRMTAIAWRTSTSAATSPRFTIIKTGTDISIDEPGMEPPIPYCLQDPRIVLFVSPQEPRLF
ncbi:hypothetical protein ELG61_30510 (plasmid) [Rhizobium leguminosarum]|uniref:hypothetical protein n=1 Tax=Rhizobium TaxID=379 RepID=UPI001031F068|nr:hypothetical protein [Rhizobium leguminosarum]TBF69378.1 hypothetical protein ELG86_31140 [Rhizobium leguminosarum]TBG96725.1 hypothetical protein ELG70_28595 [Rhizobium leguminosarum]TBG99804.1 hypothetical protein ELG68_27235 [Rhizobium leguminosarum]TBH47083.1 hypothetical protein ELG65_34865 [Rhizobium leguminosarum]TBH63321.1 hypothetical protein ELG61_30510 [Rhizobium leguminosarum]